MPKFKTENKETPEQRRERIRMASTMSTRVRAGKNEYKREKSRGKILRDFDFLGINELGASFNLAPL